MTANHQNHNDGLGGLMYANHPAVDALTLMMEID